MYEFFLNLANPVGLVGVAVILIAYFLLSTGRMSANSFIFQFSNFIGAWLILFSLYFHWNLSSVVIEIAWIAISILGMCRVFRMTAKQKKRYK